MVLEQLEQSSELPHVHVVRAAHRLDDLRQRHTLAWHHSALGRENRAIGSHPITGVRPPTLQAVPSTRPRRQPTQPMQRSLRRVTPATATAPEPAGTPRSTPPPTRGPRPSPWPSANEQPSICARPITPISRSPTPSARSAGPGPRAVRPGAISQFRRRSRSARVSSPVRARPRGPCAHALLLAELQRGLPARGRGAGGVTSARRSRWALRGRVYREAHRPQSIAGDDRRSWGHRRIRVARRSERRRRARL